MQDKILFRAMLALIGVPFLAACPLDDDDTGLTTGEYLFEIEYRNAAAQYQHHGRFINSKGEIRGYDVANYSQEYTSARDAADLSNGIPETLLELKYSYDAYLIGNVDRNAALDQAVLFYHAYDAPVERVDGGTFDAGTWSIRAWLHDPEFNTYREVFLVSCQDIPERNTSEAAAQLLDWLRTQLLLPCEDTAQ